ncbi:hypothetical protein AU512_01595 [Lonsdalea iberica]|uniref:Uncharacterized protein n=1 Tax=Lonsdalea iberica TaxID=1082703 RepID=A0ABX3XJ79_9GAMM|nr:hypothetical protein [Lonsdalea iberica]OSN11600.1 hypothetical protein AU512_01595 [Lonsdalea iberica]
MNRSCTLLFLTALSVNVCPPAFAAEINPVFVAVQSETDAQLAQAHPSELYQYAQRLYEAGERDKAVTWFYIGQLRFRYYLLANPNLPPDGEPALMASLNATLGQTINEWAGGSPKNWSASIQQALAWDAAHPNPVTPKAQHAAEWQKVRSGLEQLGEYIRDNEAEIRAKRQEAGLENR